MADPEPTKRVVPQRRVNIGIAIAIPAALLYSWLAWPATEPIDPSNPYYGSYYMITDEEPTLLDRISDFLEPIHPFR